MKFVQKLSQKQLQTLKMSYQMKLSFECLQLSSFDLKEYLENKVEENPLLELDINPVFYKNDFDFNQISKTNTSIQDILLEQLHGRNIELNEQLIETLVSLIDDNGYLHFTIDELKQITNMSYDLIKQHILWIKECEPIGVGAYDLKECLSLQMHVLYPNDTFTLNIIHYELENIANKDFKIILDKYDCTMEDLNQSLKIIQSLQPRPAIQYSNEEVIYIKPDIFLINEDDELKYVYADYYQIRVNDYMNHLDGKDKKYIEQKYQEGIYLLDSLNKRKKTLLNIMSVILKVQEESILYNKPLKSLRLIDIANELNYHETTISRALKDKYFEYEDRTFPIKSLLSKQLKGTSTSIIKNEIIQIIQNENRLKPLSDSKIQELLKEKNISISIRTINKYRDELGIKNKKIRRIDYGN